MLQKLKILKYQAGKAEPESTITIPLSAFHIAEKLMPKRIRESLEKEGIDLTGLTELFAKEGPRGRLIEIENPDGKLAVFIE